MRNAKQGNDLKLLRCIVYSWPSISRESKCKKTNYHGTSIIQISHVPEHGNNYYVLCCFIKYDIGHETRLYAHPIYCVNHVGFNYDIIKGNGNEHTL